MSSQNSSWTYLIKLGFIEYDCSVLFFVDELPIHPFNNVAYRNGIAPFIQIQLNRDLIFSSILG